MEVGVKLALAAGPEVADLGRRAETEGYDSLWVSERVAVPVDQPHPYDPSVDPWMALSFLAGATERIRLGTIVSQIALRDPVLMAREIATLDILSRGRVVVGAGAGWVEAEFQATGVPFETRGGRLSEFVRVLRRLWIEPEKGWQGKFFHVAPVKLVMPATRGGPPIWIGAANEAGLRRVARYADGFVAATLPLPTVVSVMTKLEAFAKEAGRSERVPVFAQVSPPQSVENARRVVEDYRQAGVDGIVLSDNLAAVHGFPPPGVAEALLTFAHA